jgi:hypothetical protein
LQEGETGTKANLNDTKPKSGVDLTADKKDLFHSFPFAFSYFCNLFFSCAKDIKSSTDFGFSLSHFCF